MTSQNNNNNNINNYRIDLTYFTNGNRNFECLQKNFNPKDYQESSSMKINSSNMMERNYLDFNNVSSKNKTNVLDYKNLYHEKNVNVYNLYHPEYKRFHEQKESNKIANDYLNPIGQYRYKDNPLIKSADTLFSLRKEKKYALRDYSVLAKRDQLDNDSPFVLKREVNKNILKPNILHVKGSSNGQRRIVPPSLNPNFDEVKSGSYLESKDAPEYLRNYDKECLKNIDNYYAEKNQNLSVLSRFGSWLTVKPPEKNRQLALEKLKHGTFETSFVVPEWMDLAKKRKMNGVKPAENLFKSTQSKITCHDNLKVTMLIDKDQDNALPDYMMDLYDQKNNKWRVFPTDPK